MLVMTPLLLLLLMVVTVSLLSLNLPQFIPLAYPLPCLGISFWGRVVIKVRIKDSNDKARNDDSTTHLTRFIVTIDNSGVAVAVNPNPNSNSNPCLKYYS